MGAYDDLPITGQPRNSYEDLPQTGGAALPGGRLPAPVARPAPSGPASFLGSVWEALKGPADMAVGVTRGTGEFLGDTTRSVIDSFGRTAITALNLSRLLTGRAPIREIPAANRSVMEGYQAPFGVGAQPEEGTIASAAGESAIVPRVAPPSPGATIGPTSQKFVPDAPRPSHTTDIGTIARNVVENILPVLPRQIEIGVKKSAAGIAQSVADIVGDEQAKANTTAAVTAASKELEAIDRARPVLPHLITKSLSSGLQSVPQSLASAAIAAVTPGGKLKLITSLTPFFLGAYGDSYGDLKAKGYSPEQARFYSTVQGAAEAGTEVIPMTKLIDMMGSPEGQLFRNALRYMWAEGGTEEVNTLINAAVDLSTTNPNMTPSELANRMLETAGSIGVTGLVTAGAAATGNKLRDVAGRVQSSAQSPGTLPIESQTVPGERLPVPAPIYPSAENVRQTTPTNPYADLPEVTHATQEGVQPENNLGQHPGVDALVRSEGLDRNLPPAIEPGSAATGNRDLNAESGNVQPQVAQDAVTGAERAPLEVAHNIVADIRALAVGNSGAFDPRSPLIVGAERTGANAAAEAARPPASGPMSTTEGIRNGMTQGQLRSYFATTHPDVSIRFGTNTDGSIELLSLKANVPGRGDGPRALGNFTRWLDMNGMGSALLASPEDGRSLESLVRIYEKNGYVVGPTQPFTDARLMYRNAQEIQSESTQRSEVAQRSIDEARAGMVQAGTGSEAVANTADSAAAGQRQVIPREAMAGGHGTAVAMSGTDIRTSNAEVAGFTDQRNRAALRALEPGERDVIAKSLNKLIQNGLSRELAMTPSYVAVESGMRGHEAVYYPEQNVIGIAARNLSEKGVAFNNLFGGIDTYLSHELTHMVDRVDEIPQNPGHVAQVFTSAQVERTKIALGQTQFGGSIAVTFQGDLALEIGTAMQRDPVLALHFSYPLDNVMGGQMDAFSGRLEFTAQVGALYLTDPNRLRSAMPTWFSIMEKVYGNPSKGIAAPNTVGEARSRLREALQVQGAGQRDAEGFAQPQQQFHAVATDQAGTERGPPESGVGGGIAASARTAATGAVGAGSDRRGPIAVAAQQGRGGYWDIDEPGLQDNLIREWQDNKVDLKRVTQAIQRAGGILREETMPYLLDELHQDRAIANVKRFTENAVKPLLEEIRKSNLTIDDVGDYLWARHAPEANAHLEKINPGGAKNLSGLYDTKADAIAAGQPNALNAQDLLADVSRRAAPGALAAISARVDVITTATRALLVREGLEDQGTINAWERAYKHYVPLFRDVEGAPGVGNSLVVKGPESKRRLGSQREARAIIAAVVAQHAKAMYRAEKATVGRALVKMAEENPNPNFWRVDEPPTKRYFDSSMGIVRSMVDPLYKNREDVFIVKESVNGKIVERSIVFNQKSERAMKLAAAMRSLDAVQLGAITKVAGQVNRFFANLATQWNPGFWLTNPIRDYQDMVINLQATPLAGHTARVTANIPRAIAGIASAEFRNGQGAWATRYREFEAQGGTIGWANIYSDLESVESELNDLIAKSQRGDLNPLRWADVSLDAIGKINRVMEVGTRLAVYQEGLSAGISQRQSASLAKNITVNFRRKGNRSTATNAWYLFFNARVQGTARMIQSLKNPRVLAVVGTLTAFAAALEFMNRIVGDRDRSEEGDNPYDLIPEWVKQNNTIVMLPAGAKSESAKVIKNAKGEVVGRYASLPLPYGYNLFHNAGRMTMAAILQASHPGWTDVPLGALERSWNFIQVALNAFVPFSNASTPIQFAVPSAAAPVVQYLENKTWYGSPIRPEPLPFGPTQPNYKLYFRTTSETAKDISKWLSDVSGGDEVVGGAMDISPTTLTHIFGSLTGGTGRFALGALDFGRHTVGRMAGTETPEDLPWRNVPFVGKVYGEIGDREIAGKYYDLRKRALEVFGQMKDYRKIGELDKADALEEKHPDLVAMAREMTSKTFMHDIQRVHKEYRNIEKLSRDEKTQAKKELADEETGIMRSALRAYNEERRANQ